MTSKIALLTIGLAACLVAGVQGGEPVALKPLTWAEFQKHLASPPAGTRLTIVDAWATTCAPCKQNFPHLVEMHREYGPKGLAVVSLSLDDVEDAGALAAAEKFLREKRAEFTNVVLKEDYGAGYDKLDISAIPAVFLFGPNGEEVERFTMDDPNHQFTYEQVEKEVAARLAAAK